MDMCPFIAYCVTESETVFLQFHILPIFIYTTNSAKLKDPQNMCFTVIKLSGTRVHADKLV